MFEASQSAAHDAIQNLGAESTELPLIQLSALPPKYSLSQLAAEFLAEHDEKPLVGSVAELQQILILRSCLENSTRVPEPQDQTSISRLCVWLSETTLSDSSIVNHEDESPAFLAQDKAILTRQKGVTGLLALQALLKLQNPLPSSIDPKILLFLTAYTSSRDHWTTPLSTSTANSLLSKLSRQAHGKEFIIDYVLQQFIRPLFSKSKPDAVTATGRKAMPTLAPPRRFDAKGADEKTKPWMIDVPYTVTVFEWAVSNSSKEISTSHFNLYIPPLLTLLDSTHTPIRSRALSVLATFIPLLTPTFLTQTGLGEVFEDAVTPTLMFLPSITPVDESVQLLEPAYGALVVLGEVLYEQNAPALTLGNQESGKINEALKPRVRDTEIKFWDRCLRKGILMGYAHANEHLAIVEVLLRNLGLIISKMRIHSVKHLKDIIPILTTTLTDPFVPSRSSLLLAAIKTLQTTILNCWPRISDARYRVEIVSALVLCWTNIRQASNHDDEALKEVQREVCAAGKLLVAAVSGDELAEGEFRRDLDKLFEVDGGLREVFGIGDEVR